MGLHGQTKNTTRLLPKPCTQAAQQNEQPCAMARLAQPTCAMARTTLCHGTNYFVQFLRNCASQNTHYLRYKLTCAMARTTMCHGTNYNVPWHEVVALFVPLAVHVGMQRLACARTHTVVSAMAFGFSLRVGGCGSEHS